MIRNHDIPNDRLYEPAHIAQVLGDLQTGVVTYFLQFGQDRDALKQHFDTALEDFEKERSAYQELLDPENLEEYDYDPGAFKGTLRSRCPIIRRCLQSKSKAMEGYQSDFYRTSGEKMLVAATNIVEFAHAYRRLTTDSQPDGWLSPEETGLSELDTETYTAYGVIGGGIRSHFLYNLYPSLFANRSQNAVWALYFLTDRKDYGFPDGSEFLMVEPDGSGTQQNFFYPYDLFTFYALHIYKQLKVLSEELRYFFWQRHRYIYVNTFLTFVADSHRSDIDVLRPVYDQID